MFCSKCGHEVDDDDEFCRHCGAPIHKKQETHITSTGKLPLNDHKAESGESLSFLQSWTTSANCQAKCNTFEKYTSYGVL